ncbi:MAG: flagellar basal body-associated FliL family protein [Bdellovibrionaceae bacterium]|nr:flagellar basal body-associated FliL family protein [Pseudobdellovibrionaceae bacterium]
MAEENAAAKEVAAPAASPSGGGKQNILILALAVINMVVVGAVGFMLYKGRQAEKAKPTIDHAIQGEVETQHEEKKETKAIKKPVVPLETFLVNLAGSKGRRIAKVNIELEVSKSDVQKEIDQRQAQVRDIIIMILSSKTYEYVSSKEGKNQLREEIKDTVNAFLSTGKIESVFFTEFIYN